MKKDILWLENGWTNIQEADPVAHTLEISCYAEAGIVTAVLMRHHDGEEQKLTGKLDDEHTLPMPLKDFKKAIAKNKIKLK